MEYLPNIAYDSVILGFSGEKLKILVIEYHNTRLFALPGGFVQINEDLDNAVRRGLKERTGLTDIYLEQFYTFGNIRRFQPDIMKTIMKGVYGEETDEQWLFNRFISVGYYALINYESVVLIPDSITDSCKWYNVDELPDLILDHKEIVMRAIDTLRTNIDRKLEGMNLLPEKFTMKELQHVYEAILGQKLRRTTFQRKMLTLNVLKRHEKRFSGHAHKAPFLYSFQAK